MIFVLSAAIIGGGATAYTMYSYMNNNATKDKLQRVVSDINKVSDEDLDPLLDINSDLDESCIISPTLTLNSMKPLPSNKIIINT